MAAVTAENKNDIIAKQVRDDGFILDSPVGDGVTIFKNTYVALDATGFLESYVASAQAATPGTGNRFWGMALENVDNSGGADGAKTCKVLVSGVIQYPFSAVARADVGKAIYVTDNATLSLQAFNHAFLGTIMEVPATGTCVVDMISPTARLFNGNGRIVHKTVLIDQAGTVNTMVPVLFETENHNGAYVYSLRAIQTEAVVQSGTQSVVTIAHTRGTDTTTTCIITATDNSAAEDVVQGTGGIMEISATDVALVKAPADKGVVAKLTTAGAEGGSETGQVVIHVALLLL